MKIRVLALTMLLSLCVSSAMADEAREKVEKGIATVERMIDAHLWREAFAKLREVETSSANTDALRYLTVKQRYHMYSRLNKSAETRECMSQMEQLAKSAGDKATMEDMLMAKASYSGRQGNSALAKECYLEIFHRRAKGLDDAGLEKCFQGMIAEAKSAGNKSMQSVITDRYTAWQDSIAAIKASKEIKMLQDSCATALSQIEEKESTIGWQHGTIVLLGILLSAAVAAIVIIILLYLRSLAVNKKLKKNLKISETNSEQKSFFMRNIAKQISPSLKQIAAGNTKPHVGALENMLDDVEKFMNIESDTDQTYETTDTNVGKTCENMTKEYAGRSVNVSSDAPMQQFPINADNVNLVLRTLINEVLSSSETERVVLGFKKRNPHTGQFILTAIGMHIPEEERADLFTPFAKVYDLTVTTGLALPICSLLANKMNGNLSLDPSFAKGTRFIFEVHC